MDHFEILNKLIGPIRPVGETNEDNRRFENLKVAVEVAEKLIEEIRLVSINSDRMEYSMSRAGKYAQRYLLDLKECL